MYHKYRSLPGVIDALLTRKAMRILFLSASFLLLILSNLKAEWWTENSNTDFSDGYFFRTTSTLATPEISIKKVDDWYQVGNSTWTTRKPIKITNSGAALYQYQIQLTINTSDYIAANKMRADGADIRFADEDGKTLIPYWIGISTNLLSSSQNTPIWVKVPIIPASSIKYIYMYFNNLSTATSLSDRNNVDDLYEDWESGTINLSKWTLGGDKGSWPFDADLFEITTSSKYEGNYAIRSGTITHTQKTYIEKTLTLGMTAKISFYWATSCENIYDPFIFTINGSDPPVGGNKASGETPWELKTFDLPAGNVILRWTYDRDSGGSGGMNATWLDYISVRKYTSSPPSIVYESDEDFSGEYYRSGYYMSNVFDLGGENSFIDLSSWTATIPGGCGITVEYRRSNSVFNITSSTPSSWIALTNGGTINQQSRYIQYRLNLSGPGSTSPSLSEISFNYLKVPSRPTNFRGISTSSSTINWEWTDNSNNESGFRIYSGTRTIPTSPEGFLSDTNGLLYELSPDATYYIEQNLSPNTLYNRYVVAYNSNGGNASTRFSDGRLLAVGVTTYAHPPANLAEEFEFVGDHSYQYNPISTGTVIYKSTFTFTSEVSTGPIEYYRVAFTTIPAHNFSISDTQWLPLTSTVSHPTGGDIIDKKPEILLRATFNSDAWYFHAQTYNKGNVPSGITTIGPFYYRGSPSRITDLVATPSPTEEGSIILNWTAPSDNDGTADLVNGKFVIKRRQDFIIGNDSQFDSATLVAEISTTTTAGVRQTFVVTGLTPGSIWGFAIKSVDSDNNYSALSTNIAYSTNTRTSAAKVSKLVFVTPPRTTEVGGPTSVITIEARDAWDRPLKLFTDQNISLNTNSTAGEFGPDTDNFGITFITILQGQTQANFYYRDLQSGNPTITVDEFPDAGWTSAQQQQTILPAKAVRFMISHDGAGSIGTDEVITIYANDGYNPSNISTDYEGGMISTVSLTGMQVIPSTHLYTSSDAGTKNFTLRNLFYAGPGIVNVYETIDQNFQNTFSLADGKCWAVGDEGIIKKTADNGVNWFAQKYSVGAANGIYGIHTPDSSNIFAVGESGKVFVSTNSGTSWAPKVSGVAERLNSVYFADVSTGYAVGNSGRVIKSVSSGDTWTDLGQLSGNPNLYSVFFLNTSTGFASGAGGKLFKTTDGALNWSEINTGTTDDLRKIFFYDESNAFIVTSGGKILKSSDGGETWTSVNATDQPLYGISFITSMQGLAVGDKKSILRTTNGGSNWILISSGTSGRLNSVSYLSPSVAIAAGSNGMILRSSDGGLTWSEIRMSGTSSSMLWNGVVSTFTTVAQRLVQRKNNQAVVRVGLRTLYGGNSSVNRFTITQNGSASGDTAITSVKVYRDRNGNRIFDTADEPYLGESLFVSNVAQINFSNQTISGTTSYFFITYSLAIDAPIGETLSAQFNYGCVNVSAGHALSRNNLPFNTPLLNIVPSSNTVSVLIFSTTPPTAQQGARDVRIASFTMITDIGESPFTRLRLERIGLNTDDSDIESINLYRAENWDEIGPTKLVSSATFTGGVALLNISIGNNPLYPELFTDINNTTTAQYFITAHISPNSRYSTDTQEAKFGIRTILTTSYFTLDPEGANGITPGGYIFNSNLIKITVAYDVVTINPQIDAIPILRQSDTQAFLPLKISIDGNTAVWTKVRVNRLGTSKDSDVENVLLYRDTDGDGLLDSAIDTPIGSGKFSGGVADIVFATPETINKVLPDYTTYFIACQISKRATVGATISLRLNSTSYITLGGVDVVSPANFPIQSSTATIQDYPDVVTATIKSLAPLDATVAESNVCLLSADLVAFCDATLQRVVVALEGNATRDNVKQVKIYYDSDGDTLFSADKDTLLGSGTFDATNRASINLSQPLTIYDTSKKIFIVYDFEPTSSPDKTIGAGLDYTGFQYNLPNSGQNFGYARSSFLTLLDRRTPTRPDAILLIDNPDGIQLTPGKITYFLNKNTGLNFTWTATAENGIKELKYAVATYDLTTSTDQPDVADWVTTSETEAQYERLNLRHNTTYYLWLKAISIDDFARTKTYEVKVDLTEPPAPQKPTTTALEQKSVARNASTGSGYWVSWDKVTDEESGILYYEISEKADTGAWIRITTTTATEYYITTSSPSVFYYYRIRARNYAGSWSSYSSPSLVAYLSLPDDPLSKLSSYPNPFDSRKTQCKIVYLLNANMQIDIRIYDLFGNLVRKWTRDGGTEGSSLGVNEILWDGTNSNGSKVAMGMYILSVEITDSNGQKKNKRWKVGVIH